MILPNHRNAVIDLEKLRDYCLNPKHPRGKHKSRVFESALGMVRDDAEMLQQLILGGILGAECVVGVADQYGERYFADFEISHRGHSAIIRTAWIILRAENFPRLTTCYVS